MCDINDRSRERRVRLCMIVLAKEVREDERGDLTASDCKQSNSEQESNSLGVLKTSSLMNGKYTLNLLWKILFVPKHFRLLCCLLLESALEVFWTKANLWFCIENYFVNHLFYALLIVSFQEGLINLANKSKITSNNL